MDTVSINVIKKELKILPHERLQEICLRLARQKKENKELLSYLLFDSLDEKEYIQSLKTEINEQFSEIKYVSYQKFPKAVRKILRNTNLYIKFSGIRETEVEILIHFCNALRNTRVRISSNPGILKIYNRVLERIKKVHSLLHEDMQFDYEEAINDL